MRSASRSQHQAFPIAAVQQRLAILVRGVPLLNRAAAGVTTRTHELVGAVRMLRLLLRSLPARAKFRPAILPPRASMGMCLVIPPRGSRAEREETAERQTCLRLRRGACAVDKRGMKRCYSENDPIPTTAQLLHKALLATELWFGCCVFGAAHNLSCKLGVTGGLESRGSATLP